MNEAITESESLMRGGIIENNSEDNLKNPGALSGIIAKTLLYGKERESAVDLKIGKVKKALSDFARQLKNGKNWKANNINKRRKK